jgi:hypothetical protein
LKFQNTKFKGYINYLWIFCNEYRAKNLIINNIYHDGDDDAFLPFCENVYGASCEIFYVNCGGDDSFFFLTDFYGDFYGDS